MITQKSLEMTETATYWATFFGRFHPLLVHLPIGILIIAFILEIISRKKKLETLQPAIAPILFWGMISAIFSCIAGYLLGQSGEYDAELLGKHQNQGIILAALSGIAWFLKRYDFFPEIYFILLCFIQIHLGITGHHGGTLTHGAGYLTQYTPEPFRNWLGMAPLSAVASAENSSIIPLIKDPNTALAYQDVIQPILKQRCYQCHNAEKKKGGLRMDAQDLLLKGGKNGVIFTAGNAEASEMIKRLLLPESDDHHMPPKGKNQLTEEQIALVHWWIKEGASFDKKVAQLPQDVKMKSIITALSSENGQGVKGVSVKDIPDGKMSAASESDIQKIQKIGVAIMPIANEQNWLMVNCINAANLNDTQVQSLFSSVFEQVIWLKLGDTKITDKGLETISGFKNLTKLSLEHDAITDAGIGKLQNLKNLVYLNLYGTKVSDKGIQALSNLKKLHTLFLWQTQVTQAGVDKLKKLLPNTEIVMGGYNVPFLPTDTVVAKPKKSTH